MKMKNEVGMTAILPQWLGDTGYESEPDEIEEISIMLEIPRAEVERIYNLFDEDPMGFTVDTFERIRERRENAGCFDYD